jgi:hypothetical protein
MISPKPPTKSFGTPIGLGNSYVTRNFRSRIIEIQKICVQPSPARQRRERFSLAEIHVLKLGNRPSDGVNRSEFLQILLRKIAYGVACPGIQPVQGGPLKLNPE